MKWFDKLTKKIVGKASVAAKSEVRKTALDLLPRFLGIAAMAAGVMIFKANVIDTPDATKRIPGVSNTTITTNNYFFGDVSEDLMREIMNK